MSESVKYKGTYCSMAPKKPRNCGQLSRGKLILRGVVDFMVILDSVLRNDGMSILGRSR